MHSKSRTKLGIYIPIYNVSGENCQIWKNEFKVNVLNLNLFKDTAHVDIYFHLKIFLSLKYMGLKSIKYFKLVKSSQVLTFFQWHMICCREISFYSSLSSDEFSCKQPFSSDVRFIIGLVKMPVTSESGPRKNFNL